MMMCSLPLKNQEALSNEPRPPLTKAARQTKMMMNLSTWRTCSSLMHTFDDFVISPYNRFAAAAARTAVESPASYNPLLICGGKGLGKTRLLRATYAYSVQQYPKYNIIYLTFVKFLLEYVSALADNRILQFRRKYKTCDFLLIDDVDFLAVKDRLQEELYDILKYLYGDKKQIVVTCDWPVKKAPGFKEELVSLFERGLFVEIKPRAANKDSWL